MNWQIFIVGLVVAAALFYIGLNIWRKIKAFVPKSSCGANACGCGAKGANGRLSTFFKKS